MNYLFHLYLSGDDPDILTGNFMGDFVKGRIGDEYPPGVRRGLILHRRIDSFAEGEPSFNRSRARISGRFGLYRGILVDLYYDHFLAAHWGDYCDEPLKRYLARARRAVEERERLLPQRLKELVPVIFEEMIPSYLEADGVGGALRRMAKRVRRANPLACGGEELARHYPELYGDFLSFVPAAWEFARRESAEEPWAPP